MSAEETTSTQKNVEKVAPQMVEVEMVQSGASADTGLSLPFKLVNALAVIVAGIIALCVSAVLADGTSVIKLKSVYELPIITSPEYRVHGFHHRLDELMGETYGIGLHHDQSGRSWTHSGAGESLKELLGNLGAPVVAAALPYVISTDALKHPVPLLGCFDLQLAGLTAMTFGFIAEAVAVLMVVFHTLALTGLLPSKIVKPLAGLVWFVLTAGFLIVVLLAVGIYSATWHCNQDLIPSIKLSDHFDYHYGFPFAIVGFICSLLIFSITAATDDKGPKIPLIGAMMLIGIVLAAIGVTIVSASNGAVGRQDKIIDSSVNPCAGQKPDHSGPGDNYFNNVACMKNGVTQTLEQAGANVTRGYKGGMSAGIHDTPSQRTPITSAYDQTDLCPVNVHWHLGAEHLSVGEFDELGKGPVVHFNSSSGSYSASSYNRRNLAAGAVREGFKCRHYDTANPIFTTPYQWKYCTNMDIGETYEVHWPHSAAGACGTRWQYQSPFYDGVFCNDGIISIAPLNTYKKIGVQSQVFVVVNDGLGVDSPYYYPNLVDGMIVYGDKGQDIAKYTGSTTGTSRDNSVCSRYTPITWQVDRKCHLMSAQAWDDMCKAMLAKADDMSSDIYPHGARTLVANHMVANNQQSRE